LDDTSNLTDEQKKARLAALAAQDEKGDEEEDEVRD